MSVKRPHKGNNINVCVWSGNLNARHMAERSHAVKPGVNFRISKQMFSLIFHFHIFISQNYNPVTEQRGKEARDTHRNHFVLKNNLWKHEYHVKMTTAAV